MQFRKWVLGFFVYRRERERKDFGSSRIGLHKWRVNTGRTGLTHMGCELGKSDLFLKTDRIRVGFKVWTPLVDQTHSPPLLEDYVNCLG